MVGCNLLRSRVLAASSPPRACPCYPISPWPVPTPRCPQATALLPFMDVAPPSLPTAGCPLPPPSLAALARSVGRSANSSSGIGLAAAKQLAASGMCIVLVDIAPLEQAVEAVKAVDGAGDVLPVTCDVSRIDDVVALRDKVLDVYGEIHLLLNNAGLSRPCPAISLERELGDLQKDWGTVLSANGQGIINVAQVSRPRIRRIRGRGSGAGAGRRGGGAGKRDKSAPEEGMVGRAGRGRPGDDIPGEIDGRTEESRSIESCFLIPSLVPDICPLRVVPLICLPASSSPF